VTNLCIYIFVDHFPITYCHGITQQLLYELMSHQTSISEGHTPLLY